MLELPFLASKSNYQILFQDSVFDNPDELPPITLRWKQGKLYACFVGDDNEVEEIKGLRITPNSVEVNC